MPALQLTVRQRLNVEGILSGARADTDEMLMISVSLLRKVRIPREERAGYILADGMLIESSLTFAPVETVELEDVEFHRLRNVLDDFRRKTGYTTIDWEQWAENLHNQIRESGAGVKRK